MKQTNSALGGEDSGHIILKPFMNTGDGLLIAIIVGNILQLSKTTLKELLLNYVEYAQCKKDIKINNMEETKSILENTELLKYIEEQEKLGSRIIIRPSGTEPVVRLFVEHKTEKIAQKIIERINSIIEKKQPV